MPLYELLLAWQRLQAALTCAPVNLKADELWSNEEGFQALVEWQVEQL